MMTGKNVPPRGIADSTKRESAPPAIFGMFKHQIAFDGNKLFPLPLAEISTTEAAA